MGEALDIAGTPYSLHYQSRWQAGRRDANTLIIPVSGITVPVPLKRIDLQIEVAGRQILQSFPPVAGQTYTYAWDGQDAYGRLLQGAQPVTLRLGYVYPAVYEQPSLAAAAFGAVGGAAITANGNESTVTELTVWQEAHTTVGGWDALAAGLGGWTLSQQHFYDPGGQVLYLGDGTHRQSGVVNTIDTVAGGGHPGNGVGDGLPATQALLQAPTSLAVGPDGSLYISDDLGVRIRKVGPDGIITTIAGNGVTCPTITPCGDGQPATQVSIANPIALALGPDGSLYFVENNISTNRVRRVGPDGILSTIAGTTTGGFSGDGGPARAAQLFNPQGVAVGPDGSLYIADTGNHRVRRVDPTGIISTLAGSGQNCQTGTACGDGGPAALAQLTTPQGLAVGPDGSVTIADFSSYRVRRVSADGTISTVAGGGTPPDGLGDGLPATAAELLYPVSVAVAADGSLYIGTYARVRRMGPDGVISTLAGAGTCTGVDCGDSGPAQRAGFIWPVGLALRPDGRLYVADENTSRVREIRPPTPGTTGTEIEIPSDDGTQLYVFDAQGRHLRTLNTLTGAALFTFGYDSAGRLAQVTDGSGNVTTVERDAAGHPLAIVGPYGQRTALTLDANGYLASIADPAGDLTRLSYTNDGLLTSLTDPRGSQSQMTYDATGRLVEDQNAAGGAWNLSRLDAGQAITVALTSALSRTTAYSLQTLPTGDQRRVVQGPSGLQTQTQIGAGGSNQVTLPGGTALTVAQGPDARWGMLAPLASRVTLTTPAHLVATWVDTQSVRLSDALDFFSLISISDTVNLNGRLYTTTYLSATRQFTETTPLGRQTLTGLDALGQVTRTQVGGVLPLSLAYDGHGRLASTAQGNGPAARVTSLGYNSAGFLDTLTDPLGRTAHYAYDAAGRVISQTLPDGRIIGYGYDANGNLLSVTPPGRPAYVFSYTPLNLVASYGLPAVGVVPTQTQYTYNLDKQPTHIARPDSQTVDFGYDSAGRLSTLTLGRGQIGYTYAPATGAPLSVTAPGGITFSYAYDGALLTRETWAGPLTGSVTRTYDSNLRLVTLGLDGSPINYGYDADGLLTQAGDLALSRDAQNGRPTGSALGGLADSWSYSAFGEPISYSAVISGTALFAQQFAYDKLSRIVTQTETISGTTATYGYRYDLSGRLAGVTLNGAAVLTYTYDSNDNRLSAAGPSGTVNGVYDAQDRLVSYGGTVYTDTANGDLASKTGLDGTTSYQYDALGNLLHVALPDGTQIDYLVDGQNRRIGKRVNGVLTQTFLYDGQLNPVVELDGNSQVVSRFVYGSRDNVPEYLLRGGQTYRILTDPLGSPRLVVNVDTGAVAQRLDYDAFGNVLTDTQPGFQPFGFAGGLYDPATHLLRFGARDYDAQTGRWTARDPNLFAAGRTNLYVYAGNDPINVRDLDGGIPQQLQKTLDLYNALKDKIEKLKKTAELINDFKRVCEIFDNPNPKPEDIKELQDILFKWLKELPLKERIPFLPQYLDVLREGAGRALDRAVPLLQRPGLGGQNNPGYDDQTRQLLQ